MLPLVLPPIGHAVLETNRRDLIVRTEDQQLESRTSTSTI